MALLSSTRKTTTLAPALPITSETFRKLGLVLRQGQLTLIAGAPSVGKSLLSRNMAIFTQVPTLYLSADSDEYTVKTTAIGALTRHDLKLVERNLNDEVWEQEYSNYLSEADHVEWSFDPDVNIEKVSSRLHAYDTIYGAMPKLLVIDNLGDMVTSESDEYGELREICRELRKMARYTHCHIIGLCHLKGAGEDGHKPVTLASLLGNLGKVPENVLGLHWLDDTEQRVQMTVPKARGSKRGQAVELPVDYNTGWFGGFQAA